MIAVTIVAILVGLAAVVAAAVGGLWSSYEHNRPPPRPSSSPPPPATLLTRPVVRPGDEAVLKSAVVRSPGDTAALTRLGDHYAAQRAFPAAIDAYHKAVAADPKNAAAWSGLGEAYVQIVPSTKAALPPQAHDAFVRAIAINGDELRSRFYLAMEKDFLGHHDAAIDDWVRMLAMVPAGSQADDAIRAAIVASMGRSATILRRRVDAATAVQKAAARKEPHARPIG